MKCLRDHLSRSALTPPGCPGVFAGMVYVTHDAAIKTMLADPAPFIAELLAKAKAVGIDGFDVDYEPVRCASRPSTRTRTPVCRGNITHAANKTHSRWCGRVCAAADGRGGGGAVPGAAAILHGLPRAARCGNAGAFGGRPTAACYTVDA